MWCQAAEAMAWAAFRVRKTWRCDVALEAAADLLGGLALGESSVDVGAGLGVGADPGQDDGVERPVELAVATPIELAPDRVAEDAGIVAAPSIWAHAAGNAPPDSGLLVKAQGINLDLNRVALITF